MPNSSSTYSDLVFTSRWILQSLDDTNNPILRYDPPQTLPDNYDPYMGDFEADYEENNNEWPDHEDTLAIAKEIEDQVKLKEKRKKRNKLKRKKKGRAVKPNIEASDLATQKTSL